MRWLRCFRLFSLRRQRQQPTTTTPTCIDTARHRASDASPFATATATLFDRCWLSSDTPASFPKNFTHQQLQKQHPQIIAVACCMCGLLYSLSLACVRFVACERTAVSACLSKCPMFCSPATEDLISSSTAHGHSTADAVLQIEIRKRQRQKQRQQSSNKNNAITTRKQCIWRYSRNKC